MIDNYYPELVKHLLQPDQDGPFVLLVDKAKYDPRTDEDPDDCPPPISIMFPQNSRFHDLETLEWAVLCNGSSGEFGTNSEQLMFGNLFENEKAMPWRLPSTEASALTAQLSLHFRTPWKAVNPAKCRAPRGC